MTKNKFKKLYDVGTGQASVSGFVSKPMSLSGRRSLTASFSNKIFLSGSGDWSNFWSKSCFWSWSRSGYVSCLY